MCEEGRNGCFMFLLMNGKVLWGVVIVVFIFLIVFYLFLLVEMLIYYDGMNSLDMMVNKLVGIVIFFVLMVVFVWV